MQLDSLTKVFEYSKTLPPNATIEVDIGTFRGFFADRDNPGGGIEVGEQNTVILRSPEGDVRFLRGIDYKAKFDEAADLLTGSKFEQAALKTVLRDAAQDIQSIYMDSIDQEKLEVISRLESLFSKYKKYL